MIQRLVIFKRNYDSTWIQVATGGFPIPGKFSPFFNNSDYSQENIMIFDGTIHIGCRNNLNLESGLYLAPGSHRRSFLYLSSCST